jgi:sulfur carrier protein
LNGDSYDLAEPLTISQLLATLDIDPRGVAVEHNLLIVKRVGFDSTEVRSGDQVEIVNFVGGG